MQVKQVFNQFVAEEQQQTQPRQNIPQFQTVRSSLNRKRKADLPPIPPNMAALNIQGEWKRTWVGAQFMMYFNRIEVVVLFATGEDCRLLQRCDALYVDGECTSPFSQFLIILSRFNVCALLCFCAKMKAHTPTCSMPSKIVFLT